MLMEQTDLVLLSLGGNEKQEWGGGRAWHVSCYFASKSASQALSLPNASPFLISPRQLTAEKIIQM